MSDNPSFTGFTKSIRYTVNTNPRLPYSSGIRPTIRPGILRINFLLTAKYPQ